MFTEPLATLTEHESVRVQADVVPQEMPTALRDATDGGFVLGSSGLQKPIAAMVGRHTRPVTPGRPRKEPADASQLDLPRERGNRRLPRWFNEFHG